MTARTPDDTRFAELMRGAQSGDSEAYRLLLQEIAPRVRQMIARQRRGGAATGVEDLVQDVLLSVHVARASYDCSRPFLPWLMAIVRNRLADGARRDARFLAHEVQVENLDVTFAQEPANITTGVTSDIPALRDAIRALPRGQRNAIELLKLRGLSLKEAAAATGASVGALKVATHRALAALRRTLTTNDTNRH